MRLENFLYVPDTPSAALRLLRLLGAALLLCLLCSLAFALSLAFNHQVSLSRRAMNAAMYEAQAYLGQRESLLEHLGRGLLPLAARPALEQTLILARATPGPALLPLGDGRQGLLLSPRDFAELRERRLGLLLIGPGGPGDVQRLNASGGPEAPLPAGVLRALRQAGTDGDVRWLADPADPQRRLFLLQRVGDADNWLGLEICGADLDAALRRPEAGDYLLLDRQGSPVLGDWHGATALASLRGQGEGDGFDFAGDGLLPQCVLLRKHLGAARWELVYCLGLGRLLAELWPLPLAALAILLVVGLLLRRLERRFERRLIRPARRRLAALRESEAFSRAVIQASPVALCVLRRLDASVVLQNPQARRWLGGGRMIARHGERWIARAFGGDGGAACEELASDQGRYLQLSYTPTRYKGEDVLFCAFSDISARTRAEAELARAKRLADAANQAKTVFLATMSHEIRTPLYGVLGTLELLERTRLDAQQSAYLETIQRSSGILLRLISDVLDVSRIEAGQLLLELVEFSPLELTEEVLQTFAAAARAKGLQLFACIDSRLPALARGDAVRIRQVLGNLLSNAIKFTDNGRILLRLRVQTREGARLWLLWQVLDSGIGIGSEDQRRLFEPFYQVGGSARRVGGTGLGLSICQRLTRLMHGRLSLVSELGLGSSFTLSLPLEVLSAAEPPATLEDAVVLVMAPLREVAEALCGWIERWGGRASPASAGLLATAGPGSLLLEVLAEDPPANRSWPGARVLMCGEGHLQPERRGADWVVGLHCLDAVRRALALARGGDEARPGAVIEAPAPAPADLAGLRVLMVEDNPINQLILRDQLEALGCCVSVASDGRQALQRWLDGHFEVILTDLNMPRMDGYQLAAELRRRGCRLPIIGATANAMREEREHCLAAGMNACLLKPVDLQTLACCLRVARSRP